MRNKRIAPRAGNPVRRAIGVVGLMSICLATVLSLSVGTSSANEELDNNTDLHCDRDRTYPDGDGALADALEDALYSCTALVNKGTFPGTVTHLGELWHKKVGSTLQLRTIIFGGSNTNLSTDAKLCLDDDTSPINSLTEHCLGSSGANSENQGADGGPAYPPAKKAGDAPEEAAGEFELRINLVPTGAYDLGAGDDAGGWNVNIEEYTEAVLHFNSGNPSIIALFQPFSLTEVTPIAAEHTVITTCDVQDTYTIPTTTGVQYKVDGVNTAAGTYNLPAGDSVTITAVALSGYVLSGDDEWGPFTGSTVEVCDQEVEPAAATHQVITDCGVQDTYIIPSTTGVQYKVDGVNTTAGTYNLPAGDSVTITAVAKPGYVLTGVTTWGAFVGSAVEVCDDVVTPAAPTHTVIDECGVEDTYTIPSTQGVTYFVNGVEKAAGTYNLAPGEEATVTAVANDDFVIADGAAVSWPKFTGSVLEVCDREVTPIAPTHTIVTVCGVGDTYTIPTTEGVQYKVDGVNTAAGTYSLAPGQEVTVTAVANDGFVIADGAAVSWPKFTGSSIESCGNIIIVNETTTTTTAPPTTTTEPPTTTTVPEGEGGEVIGLPVEATTTTTTTTEPELAFTADPEPEAAAGELPRTGSSMLTIALFGFGILALGSLLIASGGRRDTVTIQ